MRAWTFSICLSRGWRGIEIRGWWWSVFGSRYLVFSDCACPNRLYQLLFADCSANTKYHLPNTPASKTDSRSSTMEFSTLGKTGVKVSKICLGVMTYGSKKWREWILEEAESVPFIRRALELG